MKKKINEVDSPTIMVPKSDLKQTISDLKGQKVNILPIDGSITETDDVIEPKDRATIKYLSNVKDANTGEISKPFTIGDKKYQMVRGLAPDNKVVMGVYCFDDLDGSGENIVHDMQYFEENIAKPMKEAMHVKEEPQPVENKTIGLGEYRHYIVNEKTGKFRKFKSIEELAKATMNEEEKYMGIREFKKYFEGKVFGPKKHMVNEVTPTGDESDEEMNIKAKKLMDLIQKRIPSNVITTIKTPVARREVISAFAEMIGVPRNGLAQLISGLKDLSKTDPKQQQQQQSAQLSENRTKKIIKVKDINNG
jgi:hypothetical protein